MILSTLRMIPEKDIAVLQKILSIQTYYFDNIKVNSISVKAKRGRGDDISYQRFRTLQTHIPRGFFIVETDEKTTMHHGLPKFTGQEDESEDSLIFAPSFNSLLESSKIFVVEKINGKFVLVGLFQYKGKNFFLITSKKVPCVVSEEDLIEGNPIKSKTSTLLIQIINSFRNLWVSLQDETKETFKKMMLDGYTFQLEFMDGKHMVPLSKESIVKKDTHIEIEYEEPYCVFTALIKTKKYHDASYSKNITKYDGVWVYDWLQNNMKVPKKNLPIFKQVSKERLSNEEHSIHFTNFEFDPTKITEGAVIHFLTHDEQTVATKKVKNYFYVLLRMLRENLKSSIISKKRKLTKHMLDSIVWNLLERRCKGINAYPKISETQIQFFVDEFQLFVSWLFFEWTSQPNVQAKYYESASKLSREQNIPLNGAIVKLAISMNSEETGIGNLWDLYVETKGIKLSDFFSALEKGFTNISNPISPKIKSFDYSLNIRELEDLLSKYIWDMEGTKNTFELNERVYTVLNLNKKKLEESKGHLIILRGVPGVGKSTTTKALETLFPASVIVSADKYPGLYERGFQPKLLPKAHHWCQSIALEELSKGNTVIIDNTNIELGDVLPYLTMVYRQTYSITVIEIMFPILLEKFNLSSHDVPEDIVEKKYAIMRKTPFPQDIWNVFKQIEPIRIKGKVTSLMVPSIPFFGLSDDLERSHTLFHVTLQFKKDTREDWGGQGTNYTMKATRLLEYSDKYKNVIRCLEVHFIRKNKDGQYTQYYPLKTKERKFHITLLAKGDMKPKDSNKFFDGTLEPTREEKVNIIFHGFISLLF